MGHSELKISNHQVVLIVARRERGIALKNLLARIHCQAIIAMGLYEGLQIIIQEMPHLVLTESSLPDGDAGLLFDRLTQNSTFRNTPILVNVLRKTRKELESLAKRNFAGFFLGVSDPSLIVAKVGEVISSHCVLSPYHQDTEHCPFNQNLSLAADARILGRVGSFLVSTSPFAFDYESKWICSPCSDAQKPIKLSYGSNIAYENQRFSLFPIPAIVDKGRVWVEKLPSLGAANLISTEKVVVCYHPDVDQGECLVRSLLAYGVKGISISKFEDIKTLLLNYKGQIASLFLHELPEGYTVKRLEDQFGDIVRKYGSIFIVANGGNTDQSIGVCSIPKLYGLMTLLYRIFASLLDPKKLVAASKNLSLKGHDVVISTGAQVLGLDESGGFLRAHYPIFKGAQLGLDHVFFKNLLGAQGRIEITGSAMTDSGMWTMRFTSVAKGLSKSKYLEKVHLELEKAIERADQAETFLNQKVIP
ncbi:MAG: hypothetical protein HRU09_08845 [Oligoflexales bacterium]|nr:hypothetical protein [Oligoflexales bacterium]